MIRTHELSLPQLACSLSRNLCKWLSCFRSIDLFVFYSGPWDILINSNVDCLVSLKGTGNFAWGSSFLFSFSCSSYSDLLFWGKRQFSFIISFKCLNAFAPFWGFKKATGSVLESPGKQPNLSFVFLFLNKGRSTAHLTYYRTNSNLEFHKYFSASCHVILLLVERTFIGALALRGSPFKGLRRKDFFKCPASQCSYAMSAPLMCALCLEGATFRSRMTLNKEKDNCH